MTSIRSGLRKRKRPESPHSTEPQVSEEWVDEDKLELWEIKQYGDRYDDLSFVHLYFSIFNLHTCNSSTKFFFRIRHLRPW